MGKKFVLSILFLLGSSALIDAQKPAWVEKIPIDPNYYIGIGISAKSTNRSDYIKTAKDKALNDMASQIKINISSEFIGKLTLISGLVEQDIVSQIRTTTKEELEGYELVDTWESKNEYWVYYRLLKSLYQEQKRIKLEKTTNLSLDFFTKAKNSEKEMNFDKALMYYFQAMIPVEKYIDEPLKVNYNNSEIYLMNEIYFSVQDLLSKIKLKPLENQVEAKVGQPLSKPLEIVVTYNSDPGSQSAGPSLPIKFQFIKGSGECTVEAKTDMKGLAACKVIKITSKDKLQVIKAELNINTLLNQSENSIIIQSIFKSFSVPSTEIVMNVSGLVVYLKSVELQFGEKLEIPFIEPIVKSKFTDEGFVFTDDVSSAYLVITINAVSRKGTTITGMNMFISYLDLTISVAETTGNEIYKNSILNVKGVGRDYNAAGLKAFEKAGNILYEEIILDLINHI